MIHNLRILNTYKHPNTALEFQQGLTGIYGANESGKSMIFEMIGYALFGTVALRGSAADYKGLEVTMEFSVGGVLYKIERRASKAILSRGGIELATGQKPVNAEILRILGYDYKVFCIANYSPQGELLQLGRMKPAERKQMVDNVIGLGVIDKVIASIAERMRDLAGRVAGLDTALVEPVQPIQPEDYAALSTVEAQLKDAEGKLARYQYLDQYLKQSQRTKPEEPVAPPYEPEEELQKKVDEIIQKETRLQELDRQLLNYQPATYSASDLAKMQTDWELVHSRSAIDNKLMAMARDPGFTREQLDAWKAQSEAHQRWMMRQSLEGRGKNECPKCHHEWFLAADQLEAYKDAVETACPPRVPSAADYAMVDRFEKEKLERDALDAGRKMVEDAKPPALSMSEIQIQLASIASQAQMAQLSVEQQELSNWLRQPRPQWKGMLQAWGLFRQMEAAWRQAVKEYDAWLAEYAANYVEWEGLKDLPAQVAALRDLQHRIRLYDHQYGEYRRQLSHFETQSELANSLRFELAQLERGRESMRALRVAVKKFLVPSLNKVASYLLAQMTGGARSVIEVDEEFDIKVDGQPLATLSGSGQSVANLAIRIALGQVLIAKKFPVFMADEIDGDMDDSRAEFTAECLKRLTKHVPQLLLISHKRPVADHYIELGAN